MKHIKTAFAVLAAIFVSLSSFKKNTAASAWEPRVFEFVGAECQEYDARYWIIDSDPMGCYGATGTICRIIVLADFITGEHPNEVILLGLLAESIEAPGTYNAGSLYLNGEVFVQDE